MRISAISDIHIKFPDDEADRLLHKFLTHPQVLKSHYVVLLGDIFDLMCGPHKEYLADFGHVFKALDDMIKSGIKVYFFEGNHDVHLSSLFQKIWPDGVMIPNQKPIIEKIDGQTYYFSHGDEHEVDNLAYQRYKRLILSPPLKFVANHLMPYTVLNYIGRRASVKSRKKGSKLFNENLVRERFRNGVETTTQGKYKFVLGGHSHVKDLYRMSNGESIYINNGYALKTKTFIYINNHEVSFERLD